MSDHHIYGPSTLKYREICPGWTSDRDSDPKWANEGTLMHKAYETGDLSILETEEQRDSVNQVIEYTRPFEEKAEKVLKEQRLSVLKGMTFGTADRLIFVRSPKGRLHLHLMDAKFGRRSIDDAENNIQGIAYMVGAFETYPVDTVTVHFMIPRRDEVFTHRFTRADLPQHQQRVARIITLCEIFRRTQDVSMLRPTPDGCEFCGRKSCEALRGPGQLIAKKYEPLEVVEEVHSSAVTDPTTMSKMLTVARVMEKWCASVKKHALEMVLNDGTPVPGYEVAERAGSLTINNPVLAFQVLIEHGLEPIEIVSAASLSKTKLEELVKAKAPPRKGAQKVRDLNAALASAECLSSGAPQRYLQKIRE